MKFYPNCLRKLSSVIVNAELNYNLCVFWITLPIQYLKRITFVKKNFETEKKYNRNISGMNVQSQFHVSK